MNELYKQIKVDITVGTHRIILCEIPYAEPSHRYELKVVTNKYFTSENEARHYINEHYKSRKKAK